MRKFTKVMKALGITLGILVAVLAVGLMLALTKGLFAVLVLAGFIFVVAYEALA